MLFGSGGLEGRLLKKDAEATVETMLSRMWAAESEKAAAVTLLEEFEAAGGFFEKAQAATGGKKEKISSFEVRKVMRFARAEQLKELYEHKPAEDADDPRDIEAIERSKANTGDYKLKSAPDYEVPEDQQVNAEKKRRQMMLLEENMHSIKMRFNKRFLALRDLKRQIVESIVDGNTRVAEIDAAEIGRAHV